MIMCTNTIKKILLIKCHSGFCVKFDETLHDNVSKMTEQHVNGTNYIGHVCFPPLLTNFKGIWLLPKFYI